MKKDVYSGCLFEMGLMAPYVRVSSSVAVLWNVRERRRGVSFERIRESEAEQLRQVRMR